MSNVPRKQQSNLFSYFDFAKGKVKPEISRRIEQTKIRAQMDGMTGQYNSENRAILRNVPNGRTLDKIFSRKRYEDIWENMIEYEEIRDIKDPKKLEEGLTNLFNRGSKKNASRNASKLSREFLKTETVKEYFRQVNFEQVRPELVKSRLPPRIRKDEARSKRISGFAKQNNLFKIFNPRTNKEQLIFGAKTKRNVLRYRDVETGRFAPNPLKVKLIIDEKLL